MRIGIDVSAWQGEIDWMKARANGAEFAFIKASQQLFSDRCFHQNWRAAKAAGLPRGAYHYLTWDIEPASQARFFCRLLNGDGGDLPPVADFEENAGCPSRAAERLRVFIEEVESGLQKACMIYTSPGFWQVHGSRDAWFGQRPLWLAHWGVDQPAVPVPWQRYDFWQFTSKGDGKAFGVSSRSVDCSFAADEAVFGATPAAPPAALDELRKLDRLWAAHPELH